MDKEEPNLPCRTPGEHDIVVLARELNRLGAKYVVVGGIAMNRLGVIRATEDVDLLIAREKANQLLVRKALEILPDQAIKELAPDEDLSLVAVVRVLDEIAVDLMTSACGVDYEEAQTDIVWQEIEGVRIPFANADLMFKMKRSQRPKDQMDRESLMEIKRQSSSTPKQR